MLEDIALMRALPNMQVFSPCDAEEAKRMTRALIHTTSPAYMRIAREKSPEITTEKTPLQTGKVETFWIAERPECAIFATGMMLYPALCAARLLEDEGIRVLVLNASTIKLFDEKGALTVIKKTKAVVSVEDHQVAGGLGSVLAEITAKHFPVPQEFVGVNDAFGESGTSGELFALHKLTAQSIQEAVKKAIGRKSKV
jgi:transketolase